MQKSIATIKATTPQDIKKEKDSDKNLLFKHKRTGFIKKVLEMAKQHEQEIYICLHDKKNNNVLQYSSDTDKFNLEHVLQLTKQAKRQSLKEITAIQSLETFNDQLSETSRSLFSDEGLSETTTDTKKTTPTSSEYKAENASQSSKSLFDVSEKSTERFSFGFELDKLKCESQSLFNIDNMYGDQRDGQDLNNEDLANESSQPIMQTSKSLFPMAQTTLNKISSDMEATLDNFNDEEVEKLEFAHQEPGYDSMFPENNLNRYNSRIGDKVNFAQKYLFKNSNTVENFEEFSQEDEQSDYSDQEENSFAQLSGDACEGSFHDNDLSNRMEGPISIESSNACSDRQAENSEEKTCKSQPVDHQDMFFSCCDWEAAREKLDKQITQEIEAPKPMENFSDSDEEGIPEPLCLKQCKRKSKLQRKEGLSGAQTVVPRDHDQFDIDSVMKKVYVPQETEKIIPSKSYFSKHKRSDPKRSQIIKKISLKSQVSPAIKMEKQDNTNNSLPSLEEEVKKCLSPMGSSSKRSFDFSQTVLQKN